MEGRAGCSGLLSKLDHSVIRSISTGQLVQNVAGACKELIENALDAGATSIEVRVVDYGVTALEVVDNGCGVKQEDFEVLAQAHWTSKLANFEDLSALETYGFRGEALSAMAAMSKLTIVTRDSSVETASKLEFANNGCLKSKTPCARTVGTTVIVERFLEPLAVRRKEFERNAKNEYQKLVHVVQSYCLIMKNVRMELSLRADNNPKKTILSTYPNQTIKENACNVFGSKQLETLIDFVQIDPPEEQLTDNGFPKDAADDFQIEGLVSTLGKGAGRSTSDRQFVYLNERPCELSKILKTVNEVYRIYNRQQYPVVIMNIRVAKGNIDVNCTPDKRQVLISNEDLLRLIIRVSLTTLYDKLQGVCTIGEASSSNSVVNAPMPTTASSSALQCDNGLERLKRYYEQMEPPGRRGILELGEEVSGRKQLRLTDQSCSRASATEINESRFVNENAAVANESAVNDGLLPSNRATRDELAINLDEDRPDVRASTYQRVSLKVYRGNYNDQFSAFSGSSATKEPPPIKRVRPVNENKMSTLLAPNSKLAKEPSIADCSRIRNRTVSESSGGERVIASPFRIRRSDIGPNSRASTHAQNEDEPMVIDFRPPSRACPDNEAGRGADVDASAALPLEVPWDGYRKQSEISFSMHELRRYKLDAQRNEKFPVSKTAAPEQRFHAKITPDDNQRAEMELKRCLTRMDFFSMQAIGQFNLGFIIARLCDDLFIIDQHASDEKYNFELLQKNAGIQTQKLLTPMRLELSASQEQIIVERYGVFQKSGFDFIGDLTKTPGRRFSLTAIPHCSSCNFDKSDVEEMIAILDDDPSIKMYRPAKFRNIFASKACRKSVMIGKALNKPEMDTILLHMAETEQPWNCPHGRPTVRHLFNLRQIRHLRQDE